MSTPVLGRCTLMKPGDQIIITQVQTGGCLIERRRDGKAMIVHVAQTPARVAYLCKMEVEQEREDHVMDQPTTPNPEN